MNILHITKVKNWNGEVQQLYLLVIELKKMGINVNILCPIDSAIYKKFFDSGINTYTFDKKQSKSYQLARLIKTIIAKQKTDLIHLHSSSLLLTTIIYNSFTKEKTPILLAKKSMIRKSSILSQLKYNHNSIKKITCVSEAVKSTLLGLIWKKNINKISVVYDGINTEIKNTSDLNIREKYKFKDSDFIVGNIANHTSAKNLEIFVETANHIVNTLGAKDFKFIQIGGETKYSQTLYRLAKQYNLSENLFFMGFQNNASCLLPQFDVMLMTSKREGLPLTIFESFAYKIPVISTKAGGIPEAIEHEQTGFLSEIGDHQSLANNLIKIKEDAALRLKIVTKAKKILDSKFTQSIMAENTLKAYKECITK